MKNFTLLIRFSSTMKAGALTDNIDDYHEFPLK